MGALFAETYDRDFRSHIANPEASFALTCWEIARRGADLPAEADFERRLVSWLHADLMILRVNGEGELYYAAYGATIAAVAGFDMTGKLVSDFKGVMGAFYRETYGRVLESRKPLATVHRLGHYSERPMWERLVLPVLDAQGQVAIYVVNRPRKLQDDFALIPSYARGNGVIALQFLRDEAGAIIDACIAGANAAAQRMTGRRLDELIDRSIRECFPGVVSHALWDRYLEVAAAKREQFFRIDYRADGLDERFEVRLLPFRDGVAIDFRILPRVGADAAQASAPSLDDAVPA
jgi:PAS domain-containing protein